MGCQNNFQRNGNFVKKMFQTQWWPICSDRTGKQRHLSDTPIYKQEAHCILYSEMDNNFAKMTLSTKKIHQIQFLHWWLISSENTAKQRHLSDTPISKQSLALYALHSSHSRLFRFVFETFARSQIFRTICSFSLCSPSTTEKNDRWAGRFSRGVIC